MEARGEIEGTVEQQSSEDEAYGSLTLQLGEHFRLNSISRVRGLVANPDCLGGVTSASARDGETWPLALYCIPDLFRSTAELQMEARPAVRERLVSIAREDVPKVHPRLHFITIIRDVFLPRLTRARGSDWAAVAAARDLLCDSSLLLLRTESRPPARLIIRHPVCDEERVPVIYALANCHPSRCRPPDDRRCCRTDDAASKVCWKFSEEKIPRFELRAISKLQIIGKTREHALFSLVRLQVEAVLQRERKRGASFEIRYTSHFLPGDEVSGKHVAL